MRKLRVHQKSYGPGRAGSEPAVTAQLIIKTDGNDRQRPSVVDVLVALAKFYSSYCPPPETEDYEFSPCGRTATATKVQARGIRKNWLEPIAES